MDPRCELLSANAASTGLIVPTRLCVFYYQMPRRENKSDQRGREEHLNDGDIAVISLKNPRKRIGVVDAKTA
jgi:hypothetical protein